MNWNEPSEMPYGLWIDVQVGPVVLAVRQRGNEFNWKVLGADLDEEYEQTPIESGTASTPEDAKHAAEVAAQQLFIAGLQQLEAKL